jgi:hypothetical protein
MQTRLSTKRQVAEIDFNINKRGKLYRNWYTLENGRTSHESEMIAKQDAHDAQSESKRKTYEDAILAHEVDSELKRKAYEDAILAHEADSESKRKKYEDAIHAHEAESEFKRKKYEDAIIAHKAESESKRKAYDDAIIAHEAKSESKRKAYEDAHEAESESEKKAYKDAILTHSEHITYMQGVVTKAETKLSTVRWATKMREEKCLAHFEGLMKSELTARTLYENKMEARQLQYDQDMQSQRKAHLCEMAAQVKSEREAQRKVHMEEQLKSIRDAEREVCESQVNLRAVEAQLESIRDSERKVHAELDSERKAHHDALTALQSAHALREAACREEFTGLLRSERLAHNEYETKCLANFESIIKDEREFRFETQRLLELEREMRIMCECTL